ncbi:uncharacterized protein BJ171DRAFT_487981 [Polychytrium aggregatum]|uniref:uncharacterized protein n=1 Tax=Polychytrium aggregatum TaxID=110093 RepID=UPI0022FEB75E|nr:uncharacterized protein BJ171DRAFT_487981 [Polychytrium aggregatum]KAI9208964.1 hypothetical protein BJ171DRAFT_487981 [Polychytrium aggregatum]
MSSKPAARLQLAELVLMAAPLAALTTSSPPRLARSGLLLLAVLLLQRKECLPLSVGSSAFRPSIGQGLPLLLLIPTVAEAVHQDAASTVLNPEYADVLSLMAYAIAALQLANVAIVRWAASSKDCFSGLAPSLVVALLLVLVGKQSTDLGGQAPTPLLLLAALWAVLGSQASLYFVCSAFARSFTLGECAVVGSWWTLLSFDAAARTIYKLGALSSASYLGISSPHYVYHQALLLGMAAIGLVLYPLLSAIKKQAKRHIGGHGSNSRLGAAFYVLALSVIAVIIAPWCDLFLGRFGSIFWIMQFVLAPRIAGICCYFATLILAAVWFASLRLAKGSPTSAQLNMRRKFYHALAILLFVPGYLLEPVFMHIAFSVALSGTFFVEYLRYFRVWPWGHAIELFLRHFIDSRDAGPAVLAHIYLLVGCAVPVWLNSLAMDRKLALGLGGMLTIGVGDSMASIVGKRFGRHRWPGTKKTMEGTAAYIVSVLVVYQAVSMLLAPEDRIPIFGLAVSTLTGAMLEAVSDQNDNIMIPAYTFCWQAYFAVHSQSL